MPTTADYLNDLVAQKKALADNLNTKGVSASDTETLNTLVPKVLDISGGGGDSGSYEKGYTDGKQAQYDEFWDGYQQNGNRNNYNSAFFGHGWTSRTYKPKYPITVKYGNGMFQQASITDTLQPITFQSGASAGNVFLSCTSLVTIQPITVTSDIAFSGWFSNCGKLTNITFTQDSQIGNNIDFSASPLLSHNSIINIISVLINTTTKKTLSLGAENLAKLTDEEKAVATEKGWTLA